MVLLFGQHPLPRLLRDVPPGLLEPLHARVDLGTPRVIRQRVVVPEHLEQWEAGGALGGLGELPCVAALRQQPVQLGKALLDLPFVRRAATALPGARQPNYESVQLPDLESGVKSLPLPAPLTFRFSLCTHSLASTSQPGRRSCMACLYPADHMIHGSELMMCGLRGVFECQKLQLAASLIQGTVGCLKYPWCLLLLLLRS